MVSAASRSSRETRGIEPLIVEDPGTRRALARDREAAAPDLLFSFYFRGMLPDDAPGAAAAGRLQHARLAAAEVPRPRAGQLGGPEGRDRTGATLHVMTARPDAGDIVDQEQVPIGPDDTACEVQSRVTAGGRQGSWSGASRSSRAGPRRAARRTSRRRTTFGRRQPGGRAHRLDADRAGGPRPRPRRDASVSRRLHGRLRRQDATSGRRGSRTSARTTTSRARSASERGRLYVACGDDRYVEILRIQRKASEEMDAAALRRREAGVAMKVLILGVNGFIGNALTERILDDDRLERLGPRHRERQDRAVPRPPALHVPRGRHRDQQGVDRVPGQEVRRRPAARRDRDAGDVREEPAGGLRARLRGEPPDRQAGGALRQARRLPVDLRGLRDVPRRRSSTRRARRSSTARSASSAGSTPARSSCSTGSSGPTARRRACSSRSSARSTGSARTSTTSTRPRKARAASSRSSSTTSSTASRSSSWTAARSAAPSPTSPTASTA